MTYDHGVWMVLVFCGEIVFEVAMGINTLFRFSFLCFPLVVGFFHRTVWNCRESVQYSIGYIAVSRVLHFVMFVFCGVSVVVFHVRWGRVGALLLRFVYMNYGHDLFALRSLPSRCSFVFSIQMPMLSNVYRK